MTAHAMSSGELSLPVGSHGDAVDTNALRAEAPIHQLAEEIVRAALDIDPDHPDAARVRELVNAIAHPVDAHVHPFTAAPARRLASIVRRGAFVMVGLGLAATVALAGQAFAGGRFQAAAPRVVEARVTAAAPTQAPQQLAARPQPSPLVPALLTSAFQDQVAGHADQAITAYLEVLREDPGNRTAEYNLGVIDQAANRIVSAEEHYRAALITDADFVPALFNLAIIRTGAGAADEAALLYRHVLAVDPASAPAHLNLGILLVQGGQQDAGGAELRQAVAIDPSLAWRVPVDGIASR